MAAKTDQNGFVAALLNPDCPAPPTLRDPQGGPAGKRFDVYRNNVAVSLTEALQVAFPVVQKLVGAEFFKAMTGVFLRQHPPKSPVLMLYGSDMPSFLANFEPVSHLAYLPDIARLELALRQSYNAEDQNPINPNALQSLAADRLMVARFSFAPAVRLLQSEWPIHSIWRANTEADAPEITIASEDVLVVRPELDPVPVLLPDGGARFIAALQEKSSFGHALEQASAEVEDFDLTATLGLLLANGAITEIHDEEIR